MPIAIGSDPLCCRAVWATWSSSRGGCATATAGACTSCKNGTGAGDQEAAPVDLITSSATQAGMRMAEDQPRPEVKEDIFAEHADWLAAEARQLFRAHRARDTKAVEVALFYFIDYMTKILYRHLSTHDSAWDNSLRPLDFPSHRWFDGLNAEPDFPAPGRLRLRGEVYWLIGQEQGHYDPLDFEIELCPMTGAFRRYVFRFGDSRPRAAKVRVSATPGIPVGAWAYEFARQNAKPSPGANADFSP